MRFAIGIGALLAAGLAARAAPYTGSTPERLERGGSALAKRHVAARQRASAWQAALEKAITEIHRHGSGGYSTGNAAHDALAQAFAWDGEKRRLVFNPAGARPSFCSGAVYAAVLSALVIWDARHAARRISPEAWQALGPAHVKDGIGPWGYANANGPGFAVLVHRLGAGYSFTEWEKARPADVMKIWWNDKIGAGERGHLVILVRNEGDSVRVWSSNSPTDGAADGYGFKTFRKDAIRRVLFTRVTTPAAFGNAAKLPDDAWLTELMSRNATWEECAARCGLKPRQP